MMNAPGSSEPGAFQLVEKVQNSVGANPFPRRGNVIS